MAKRNSLQSTLRSADQPRYHYTYLEHQKPAVNAVVDVFRGIPFAQDQLPMHNPEAKYIAGYEPTIMRSVHEIQQKNHIYPLLDKMSFSPYPQFDIEMETGTGKTYVYLRTAYALHQAYGLSKFIVIVPSRAIFEGVADDMQFGGDLDKHLKDEFKDIGSAKYCVYAGGDTSQVISFTQSGFAIMLLTLDAFNRDSNILNRQGNEDSPDGRPLIKLIGETHPIVILDEPQKKSGGDASQEALKNLQPMCLLNYSATHRVKHTLLYRLDPVQSFEQKLVKGLTVTGFGDNESEDCYFKFASYFKLTECRVINNGKLSVKFEYLDLNNNQSRIATLSNSYNKVVTTQPQADDATTGDVKKNSIDTDKKKTKNSMEQDFWDGVSDLASVSNNPGYAGWYFDKQGIVAERGDEHVTINGRIFRLNEKYGDDEFDDDGLRKLQIAVTVKSHLELEKKLIIERGEEGLSRYKVLSLFFIDVVNKYATGKTERNGDYAKWFREIYKKEIENYPEVKAYWKQYANNIDQFHNGYFAQKQVNGKATELYSETTENWESSKDKAAQLAVIKSIVEGRKSLRKLTNPLRFIFSHSALQEGWDNPNVFQICTLAVNHTDISKRQRIGRGMRLPVDEFENRNCLESNGRVCPDGTPFIYDESINRLHVIANQSFKSFAQNLQKDYEDAGIVFGECSPEGITALSIENKKTGKKIQLDFEFAREVMDTWKNAELIETKTVKRDGVNVEITRFTDKFIQMLEESPENISLPELPKDMSDEDRALVRKAIINYCNEISTRQIPVKNKKKSVTNERLDKTNPEKKRMFDAIYERIKYETGYRYSYKTSDYINECVQRIVAIKASLQNHIIMVVHGNVALNGNGVAQKVITVTNKLAMGASNPNDLPDVIDSLVEAIGDDIRITRRTLIEIINQSESLESYFVMPEQYIKKVSDILKDVHIQLILKNGLEYYPNGKTIDKRIFNCNADRDAEGNGKLLDTLQNEKGEPRYHDIGGNPRETKSLYRYIKFDSKKNEQEIQKWFETNTSIKMYAKLPDAFIIQTPCGTYNPDWAIVREENGKEEVYFVFESKTASAEQIRRGVGLLGDEAKDKIDCAALHFRSINDAFFPNGDGIRFFAGNLTDDLKNPTWKSLTEK